MKALTFFNKVTNILSEPSSTQRNGPRELFIKNTAGHLVQVGEVPKGEIQQARSTVRSLSHALKHIPENDVNKASPAELSKLDALLDQLKKYLD